MLFASSRGWQGYQGQCGYGYDLVYSGRVLDGLNVIELVSSRRRRGIREVFKGLLSGFSESCQFKRFRTFDRAYRWLRWTASYHSGGVFATANDITKSEANLEKRYRRLFEAAKDAIVLLDASNGKILNFNRRMVQLTGVRRTGTARPGSPRACAPFVPDNLGRRLFEALQSSETFRSENGLATKTGSPVPCELLCNRYLEGQFELIQNEYSRYLATEAGGIGFAGQRGTLRMLVEGFRITPSS